MFRSRDLEARGRQAARRSVAGHVELDGQAFDHELYERAGARAPVLFKGPGASARATRSTSPPAGAQMGAAPLYGSPFPMAHHITLDRGLFEDAEVESSGMGLEDVVAEEGDEGPRGTTWAIKLRQAGVVTDILIYV